MPFPILPEKHNWTSTTYMLRAGVQLSCAIFYLHAKQEFSRGVELVLPDTSGLRCGPRSSHQLYS